MTGKRNDRDRARAAVSQAQPTLDEIGGLIRRHETAKPRALPAARARAAGSAHTPNQVMLHWFGKLDMLETVAGAAAFPPLPENAAVDVRPRARRVAERLRAVAAQIDQRVDESEVKEAR